MNSTPNDSHDNVPWPVDAKAFQVSAFQLKLAIAIVVLLLAVSQRSLPKGNALVKAPFVGSSQAWLARVSFLTGATKSISSGYTKVGALLFCGSYLC